MLIYKIISELQDQSRNKHKLTPNRICLANYKESWNTTYIRLSVKIIDL